MFDDAAVAERCGSDDLDARRDPHAVAQDDRAVQLRGGIDAAALTRQYARCDLGAERVEPHFAFERVVVCLLVLLEVADVGPVRVDDVAAEFRAVAQHLGKQIFREIVVAAAGHSLEDRGLEHVDAGVDRIGEHLAPRRLLEEARDAAGFVGDDDAELQGVRDALQRDRNGVPFALVMFDERGEIDVGERIARDDEERFAGQQLVGHLDGAGGAEGRIFDHVLHRYAEVGAASDDVLHHRLAGNGSERLRTA